jgi:hypothetical protein
LPKPRRDCRSQRLGRPPRPTAEIHVR